MRSITGISLSDVTAAYGGPQGHLFILLMGQLLHVGGMHSSIDLAERAGISAGQRGIDLCCGNGGGMRVLLRFRNVASMTGVDATERSIERGRARCHEEGFADRSRFVLANAVETDLPRGDADFVWGEDAWCYVEDKPRLISEAARLVRPGGVIAFTDWVEGPEPLTDSEADRCLRIMSFSNIEDIDGYRNLLERNHYKVVEAEDTGRLAGFFDLALKMLEGQLAYDALATVGFRTEALQMVVEQLHFLFELASARKIIQARFIAHATNKDE